MQNVQVLLQPTEIETQPEYVDSRWVGSVDGKTSSDSRISTCGRLVVAGAFEQDRQGADVVRTEHDVDPGRACLTISPRSFWARQPPTAICMPGLRVLTGARWPRLP